MEAYQSILSNIRRYVELTDEEAQRLVAIIQTRKVKKRQFIVQPGFVCQHRTYVVKGAFKVYYLDQRRKSIR
jgi:Mlc titration factor MtfA (ptsG expression regulator)